MLAETGRQPVDQESDLPAGILIAVEADGDGLGFFRQQSFQPDQVEAEAGVQRIGQRIQPLPQQPQHDLGIAQRRARS